MVDLPPPDGPTSAVTLPGSATKRQAAEHRLARPVGEVHVGEFDARGRELERRAVVVDGSVGGAVDDVEQDAHADQRGIEIDVEAREPLGRLVGEQERGQEREELARRRAGLDHAVAAVDHGDRDRDAAERLHQRAGAVGDARHLVGLLLELGDVGVEARAHRVLEREGLDDADALHGLLQGLEDARAAGELPLGDAGMRRISLRRKKNAGGTITKLKSDITGSCTTITVSSPMSDSRSRPTAVMSRLMTWLAAAAPVVEPREEFGRMPVGEEVEVLVQQLVEHPPLVVGDDAVADPRQASPPAR